MLCNDDKTFVGKNIRLHYLNKTNILNLYARNIYKGFDDNIIDI